MKYKSDGTMDRCKARLVTHGIHQQACIDYHETFNPIVKTITIPNWPLRQLDVKNAFLYRHLTEKVYMKYPPDFAHSDKPQYVCRLKNAIDGLKQAH